MTTVSLLVENGGGVMAFDSTIDGTASVRPGLSRVIIAATIATALEIFDFVVYGFFAVTIAEVFFPASNPTVSLLVTFGTFGLGYVARPLGAVIIGTYSDRAGRKAGLTLSIGLMLIGTTLMVITPGYATIGIAAPIIITLARLLQGFSMGGESGSAVAFLVEHGGERRGFSASWLWASAGIVSVTVSLFGVTLTTQLSPEQLIDWGWRIPYVFGLLVGPVGLYIRSHIDETPDFLKAERSQKVSISDLLRRYPVPLLLALGASIVSNSSYFLLLYIPTYGIKTLHLPGYTGFLATLVGGVVLGTFSVVAGHRSDKTVPRTRIMLITGWLFLLAAYPCFWLMDVYPSVATTVFAVGFLNLIKGGYSGVLPSVLCEQFPVETRAVGVALAFSISLMIFGGFAPFVATWLIAQTGDPLSPSYYLMATALLSIIALMAIEHRASYRKSDEIARSVV
jgi:MHS family proline/betaine transporter-like MFS transporter